MNKNYSRDMQILTYILKNQVKIKDALKDFNCDFSNTNRGITNHKYAFDLCSMYMAQIGENVKLLSDNSREALKEVCDLNILKYFRNMIDHDYEKVNKSYLQAYIQLIITDKAINIVRNQIKECTVKKKEST